MRDNNITRKRATFKHFPKTYRGKCLKRTTRVERIF